MIDIWYKLIKDEIKRTGSEKVVEKVAKKSKNVLKSKAFLRKSLLLCLYKEAEGDSEHSELSKLYGEKEINPDLSKLDDSFTS